MDDAVERLGDRYRLVRPVGRGGMSVVWLAHDEVLDRRVAVKTLNQPRNERFRERLRLEARACGRLNTHAIAQVYDYGEAQFDDGELLPYVVMEFVDGQPLSRLLDESRLSYASALDIGAQVASALSVAHAAGLVHRDIKPGNIMVTDAGVKLIDFGIAASVGSSDLDDEGQLLGTAAYLAPERIVDTPVSAAADVYALGVVLYRALTGRLPWPDEDTRALLRAHLFVEPTPLPADDASRPRLAQLCAACLDKDSNRRPTSAALAAELSALAAAAAVTPAAAPSSAATAALQPPNRGETRPYDISLLPLRPIPRSARWRRSAAIIGGGLCLALLAVPWFAAADRTDTTDAAPATPTCRAEFAVTRDWGDGFTATLSVTNESAVAVPAWDVAFSFSGDQTLDAPAASQPVTVRQNGQRVSAATTRDLAPRQTVTVPISAHYDQTNPIPTQFELNGQPCATTVAGAASQPSAPPAPPPPDHKPGKGPAKHGKGDGDQGNDD